MTPLLVIIMCQDDVAYMHDSRVQKRALNFVVRLFDNLNEKSLQLLKRSVDYGIW